MTTYQTLLTKLHRGVNPYAGFPSKQWSGVWFNDPGAKRGMFDKAIDLADPKLIIEVGSFVGESAIYMANYIKTKRMDCAILCVDTWYAGFDHYKGAPEKINMHFGRSDLFYRFMANVIEHECQNVIVPFAMDSVNAARILKWMGIVPDLIYVDASHEKGDVIRDYEAYWDLLSLGGYMLCDDWSNCFPEVMEDGHRFMGTYALTPLIIEGEKVLFQKPV